MKDYHKKTGTTVLLVSHSMEDIAKYADKVLVMRRNKIAMYATVALHPGLGLEINNCEFRVRKIVLLAMSCSINADNFGSKFKSI